VAKIAENSDHNIDPGFIVMFFCPKKAKTQKIPIFVLLHLKSAKLHKMHKSPEQKFFF
jgi:hypothetical protein